MDDTTVITPAGPRKASLVHKVAPGNTIDESGGRLRERDADGNVVADYGPVGSAQVDGLGGHAGGQRPDAAKPRPLPNLDHD